MARIDGFLKIESPTVTGEAEDSKHQGEIQILAWGWKMTNSSTVNFGTGSGSGKVNIGELVVVKNTDKATSSLIKSATRGTHFGNATLILRKATGDTQLEYLKLEMKEVFVTSLEQGDLNNTDPEFAEQQVETVKFTFRAFKITYQPQGEAGAGTGDQLVAQYDIKTNSDTF